MELVLIICGGIAGVLLGRVLMKRWYNHLTIYSFLWTLCLTFTTFRLILYYNISSEAWFFIILSWFMLNVGSFAVIFAHRATQRSVESSDVDRKPKFSFSLDLKFLSRSIVILSIISLFAIIIQLLLVVSIFGSFGTALMHASLLYGIRAGGELGGIPYLTSFPLAASCLAGIYTALRKKLTLLAVVPAILAGFHGIIVMGRTNLLIAGALFLTALFYTPHKRFMNRKVVISIVLVVVLVLGAFTFISSSRGFFEQFKYESREMASVRSVIVFMPSVYFYISAPPVAFSEYLLLGEENFFPGTYTFKPVFNILSKIGFVDRPMDYNPFIGTPESINAGTYLREIHADFGPLGIMIFPFLLGIVLAALYFRVTQHPTTIWIVLFAHFFVIIWSSWDINVMKLGQWVVSILVSLFVAWRLDSMAKE